MPYHERNEKLLSNARALRKNATKEERHLWLDYLRDYPVRFRRQEIIGSYIGDFYCSAAKIVVELDGSQHFEESGRAYDDERDAYLRQQGIAVLRFANSDIWHNFEGVCMMIDLTVRDRLNTSSMCAPERGAVSGPTGR